MTRGLRIKLIGAFAAIALFAVPAAGASAGPSWLAEHHRKRCPVIRVVVLHGFQPAAVAAKHRGCHGPRHH